MCVSSEPETHEQRDWSLLNGFCLVKTACLEPCSAVLKKRARDLVDCLSYRTGINVKVENGGIGTCESCALLNVFLRISCYIYTC